VSVDPIYVYFSIDSPTLLKFREQVRQGKLLEKSPGKIPVEMEMETQTGYPWKGIVEFAENRFDPATGTLELRAEFANPKPTQGTRELSPGLFVRVRIPLGPPRQVLAIPDRCVQNDLVEQFVYVVDEKNQVVRRPVETGSQVDSLRVIETGLVAGDRVIERGIQKVVPGVEVQIETSAAIPPPGP
jgi:RND family efflux transporter MFP subunit